MAWFQSWEDDVKSNSQLKPKKEIGDSSVLKQNLMFSQ
jgi:hypothetical protein